MYILGIILLLAVGYLTVFNISTRTTRLERMGLSFPVGVGIVTFVMALMDLIRIPLTPASLITASLLIVVVMAVFLVRKRARVIEALHRPVDMNAVNLVWIFFFAVIVCLEYANFTKCMFFPVYDRDSLAAFDTLGYVAAQEHTFGAMSIFTGDYVPGIHGPGSPIAYFPLLQLAYAYVYALGAETSKIIPALMYLSFLIAFYAILRRTTNRLAAIMATMFVLLTPEMTSFSSLSGTNTIQAVYASLGIIYILTWYANRESGNLYLGSLLLACNVWSRAEGIVFIGVAGLLILFACLREKKFRALVPIALTLVPVVFWQIFTRCFGMTTESFVIMHPFFDGEKAGVIFDGAIALLTNIQYYGWTFAALLLAVLADVYFMVRYRVDIAKLVTLVLAILFYYILLYQVDYKWDSINNVLAYSAKRYMFCYVPVAWYFVATCYPVNKAINKFDDFLNR